MKSNRIEYKKDELGDIHKCEHTGHYTHIHIYTHTQTNPQITSSKHHFITNYRQCKCTYDKIISLRKEKDKRIKKR